MNKMVANNIIKVILLINVLICLNIIFYSELLPEIFTILLPISAIYMNRYKKNVTKYKFLYHVIRKIVTFFSIVWISILLFIIFSSVYKPSFIMDTYLQSKYFTIMFVVLICIDILININKYKNNLIYPFSLLVFLINARLYTNYFISGWGAEYTEANMFIFLVLSLLIWINGLIELKRIEIKKESTY